MSSLELDRRLADLAEPKTRRGVLVGAGSLALAASLSRLPLDLDSWDGYPAARTRITRRSTAR